jgi:outer membrane immunogenic protein
MLLGVRGGGMMIKTLFSCAALLAATALANAADFPAQPPLYVPTWTGCYIGGHAGYGSATSTSYYATPVSPIVDPNGHFTTATFIQDFSNKGFVGGVQAGCQQQLGLFLWGAEGDWSSFDNGGSHNFSSDFDEGGGVNFSQTFNQSYSASSLWSIRGRLGVVFLDAYHFYATAGVGGATIKYAYSGSFGETSIAGCVCTSVSSSVAINPTGIVVGAGAEWKIWSNLVLGAEYLHYMFEADSIIPITTTALNPLVKFGDHVHTNDVDVFRVRASWLFNMGP